MALEYLREFYKFEITERRDFSIYIHFKDKLDENGTMNLSNVIYIGK